MSGFKDSITDELVMAGSPDTLMCFAIDFDVLLGKAGRPIIGFKKLKELCEQHNKTEYLERIELAEKLIIGAQRLFCYPDGKPTHMINARNAVKSLNVK